MASWINEPCLNLKSRKRKGEKQYVLTAQGYPDKTLLVWSEKTEDLYSVICNSIQDRIEAILPQFKFSYCSRLLNLLAKVNDEGWVFKLNADGQVTDWETRINVVYEWGQEETIINYKNNWVIEGIINRLNQLEEARKQERDHKELVEQALSKLTDQEKEALGYFR